MWPHCGGVDAAVHEPDNHWFDCLVGCAAAASMRGIALPGMGPVRRERKRIKLSELQREKRRQRGW